MPEELGEGLSLAATGMGMVFLTLVIFLLILLALRTLFPGEETTETIENDEATVSGFIEESQQASIEPAPAIQRQPSTTSVAPPAGSIPGAKIAAMAVAMYLAMEQEEGAASTLVATTAGGPPQSISTWGIQGRTALWQSQGGRPQAYDQKGHSAYPKGTGAGSR
ncbi:MAG: OadG-related small transporter subunit [Chloroflexi bacterium]|nr:OadG-related small transporter subunit [Chloroflexota bacterium]